MSLVHSFVASISESSSNLMIRNNDAGEDVDGDDNDADDYDGNCLGWSISPTRSTCLTVTLLKPNCYCNFYQILITLLAAATFAK